MPLERKLQSGDDDNPVDVYFAKKIAPNASQPVSDFLAKLLKAAREGNLCLPLEEELPQTLFEEVLVEENGLIYLRRNWECEKRFLHHFQRVTSQKPHIEIPKLTLPSSLEHEQQEAIFKARKTTLSLICGGPGTGKSYTAALLIRHFYPFVKQVAVAAPTGKATANLRTALEGLCTVETLHSCLKKQYLTSDLVLIDEASMIDAELMATLFAAMKEGARLILIGDKDQLPPVGLGNFFADIAETISHVTTLKRCLRSELNEIVEKASAVKEGKSIPCLPLPSVEAICEAVFKRKACVLTPLRHGPYGVITLNQKLHKISKENKVPIIITVNDPLLELFNGDVGVLDLEDNRAYFGKRQFPIYRLPPFEYAYVLSVHKSQGSEYDDVMVLLPEGSEVFGRQMLYTAITRAKKRVDIYAKKEILDQVLSKQQRRLAGVVDSIKCL